MDFQLQEIHTFRSSMALEKFYPLNVNEALPFIRIGNTTLIGCVGKQS